MSPLRLGRPAVLLLLIAAALAGCGLKATPIPPSDSEIGNRPGLLSGPSGAYTF